MSTCKFGALTVLVLVALRIGIGWHFFKEGSKKLKAPSFAAAFFLQSAKGPWAGLFHGMISDRLGKQRLNRNTVSSDWKKYVNQSKSYYGFDDAQAKRADAALKRWTRNLTNWSKENREDLGEYFRQVNRSDQLAGDPHLTKMSYYSHWYGSKPRSMRAKMNGWLADVNGMARALQGDLYDIANSQQRDKGQLPLPDRSKSWLDTAVKVSIFSIGACLIIGLFTRLAALGGICFLGTVMATQPFWVPTADLDYAYYQAVEILALVLLAVIGAGRFAGLDFILGALCKRCCAPKSGE